jgi:photosystem II reaction center protein PsbP
MPTYINEIISFKYGENWIKTYNSKDPFSIIAFCNNLSKKSVIDISRIPINYNIGKTYDSQHYKKSVERYIKNRPASEILKKDFIEIAGEKAYDIWAKRIFNDVKIEERFIGLIKNQYIYQFKIITDKDLNLLFGDVETIITSFNILDKKINPPNRFSEKEIKEILEKSRLFDKRNIIKISKNLLKVVLILLTILLAFLILGLIIT